jgi:serine/threonine protein kinase
MFDINYVICSQQIGSGTNGKVYKIREINNPNNIKIAKIFEEARIQAYQKERNILTEFSNQSNNISNDYLIKLSNIEVFMAHDDNYPEGSGLLIFDYLINGKLCDYIYKLTEVTPLKESYVKILCYKLLIGLKKCHEKNISHNKIDIKNIMFDNSFNPIIIHFSNASRKYDNNFGKDFLSLGAVLAKLMSSGKFKSFGKTEKKCVITCTIPKNSNQKNYFEFKEFWEKIEDDLKIKISKNFKNFFDTLINHRNKLKVDDLLNSEWLKDINLSNISLIEAELKQNLQTIHDLIYESNQKSKYNLGDYSSIINLPKENNNNYSIINECYQKLISKKNENKDEWGMNNYNIVNENYCEYEDNENNNYMINYDKTRGNYEDMDEYENKYIEIKTLQFEPKDIQFNYIEIDAFENADSSEKFLKDCIKELRQKILYNSKENNINVENVEYLKGRLGLKITFKYVETDEEEGIECLEEEDSEDDKMPCIIEIEVFKYQAEQNSSSSKYYLLFNYIQGDIADFYKYLNFLKSLF